MGKASALIGVLVMSGLASLPAASATIALPSPGQMFWTGQFVGSSGGNTQTTPTGSFGSDYSLSVPGQYSFLDSFGNQASVLTGPGTSSPIGSYSFQDTYEFSLAQAASGDALTVSLNLGQGSTATFNISDLQFRLYQVPAGTQPSLSLPAVFTPVTNGWVGASGPSNGASIQANFASIPSGTYFLDVAGTADGQNGGTYLGQLNLAPVPLPAALPLLLSGLGLGLAGAVRRRRAVRDATVPDNGP
jgi:hypothetical protein